MDKVTVSRFWEAKAKDGSTRWTGTEMLDFERDLLRPLIGADAVILDLGSGLGELSRSLTPGGGHLVAVDAEPGMAAGFAGDERFEFETADVSTYRPRVTADVILLFGVVTYLTVEEEGVVYDAMRDSVAADGLVIVKNQCSDAAEFEVDTDSAELGHRYVGRYPSVDEQRERLMERFGDVEVFTYPPQFKVRSNSTHVAFFCRGPRRLGA